MANKRNCAKCKYCVYKKTLEGATINTCVKETELKKLTLEELADAIESGTCAFYESGRPIRSNEICYED